MTVSELIAELSKCKPTAQVMHIWRETEAREVLTVGKVKLWNKGRADAFYALVLNDDTEKTLAGKETEDEKAIC